LGVPMDWITVYHGNTDITPFGWGTLPAEEPSCAAARFI